MFVVLPQDGDHFRPTELGRDLLALRQHLALACAGDREMVLRIVRAGLAGSHAAAPVAIERHIDLERLAGKRTLPELVEDVLGIERTIVAANPRVVAPND